jgi:hypothetical protein
MHSSSSRARGSSSLCLLSQQPSLVPLQVAGGLPAPYLVLRLEQLWCMPALWGVVVSSL